MPTTNPTTSSEHVTARLFEGLSLSRITHVAVRRFNGKEKESTYERSVAIASTTRKSMTCLVA